MADGVEKDPESGAVPLRKGSNQRGMRNYNERLIIDTIRQRGEISKADLAKLTKLSPQTATIIVNRLIEDGLLRKLQSVKGKVGQPRTPITLDAQGAYSFGVKVGRRSVDIFLVDFTYTVVDRRSLRYSYAVPDTVLAWVIDNLHDMTQGLSDTAQSRILGVGLAQPFELENWQEVIGAPEGTLEKWRGFDLRGEIEAQSGFATYYLNDASSACLAEMSQSPSASTATFLYIYIGTFVGGGVAIGGQLFEGVAGNAGALASMPLAMFAADAPQKPVQLIEIASFNSLDQWARQQGYPDDVFDSDPLLPDVAAKFAQWCKIAGDGLAMAIVSSQAILDLDFVVIDGSLPDPLKMAVEQATRQSIEHYDLRGISVPLIKRGHLGNDARAMGAALLPFRANFAVDETAFAID